MWRSISMRTFGHGADGIEHCGTPRFQCFAYFFLLADGAHFTGRIDMNHKGVAAKQEKPLSDPQAERLLAQATG